MPLMVIPNEGKLLWLQWMIRSDGDDFVPFELRLFKNDYTPDENSTLDDFDNATFPGYLEVEIARADFTAPVIFMDTTQTTAEPTPTFVCDGEPSEEVYGWYLITNELDPSVMATARFNFSRLMQPGTTLKLDPFTITLQTLH